jgi:hypothetical protein
LLKPNELHPVLVHLVIIATLLRFLTCVAYAAESRFAKLTLPLGVTVEVPKNWRLLGGDYNTSVETAAEAALKLGGIPIPDGEKLNLFRANSMPTTTYAGVAINASDSDLSESTLLAVSNEEIAMLSPALEAGMRRSLATQGMQVLDFEPVRKLLINGHPALVLGYTRSGPEGSVRVIQTRLPVGAKEISIVLSYRESESVLWKPVVTYIQNSIAVDADKPAPSSDSRALPLPPRRESPAQVPPGRSTTADPAPVPGRMEDHEDRRNGFAIRYPSTWSKVQPSHPQRKLKIQSERGAGTEDLNVVVVSNPAFNRITPERYVQMMLDRPEAVLARFRQDYPDAKILSTGKMQLGGERAYHVTFDATIQVSGLSIPWRFFQVQTIHKGRAYYLTCRATSGDFDALKPQFTGMIKTFRFVDE